jgi:hypothetical protein
LNPYEKPKSISRKERKERQERKEILKAISDAAHRAFEVGVAKID